jgi:alpha-tubulin suppressor-like RCC1 family protein
VGSEYETAANGGDFTVAVKADGTLWSWGRSLDGALGLNNSIISAVPVQVGSDTNWQYVSCSTAFVQSIKTDGTLWSWGSNGDGGLGFGERFVSRSSPVQVGALSDWAQISCGQDNALAIKVDGTLWAWGSNENAKLGLNDTQLRSSPVQVGALSNWAQVSAGVYVTHAIKTDGTLWAWGNSRFEGLLGNSTRQVVRSSPIQIGALSDWAQIADGEVHVVAIKTNGTIWSWGQGSALGQNNLIARSSPVQIGALSDWSQVTAGNGYTIATKTDGTLWAWGGNSNGTVGDGTIVTRSSPVQIGSLTNWDSVTDANPTRQTTGALSS